MLGINIYLKEVRYRNRFLLSLSFKVFCISSVIRWLTILNFIVHNIVLQIENCLSLFEAYFQLATANNLNCWASLKLIAEKFAAFASQVFFSAEYHIILIKIKNKKERKKKGEQLLQTVLWWFLNQTGNSTKARPNVSKKEWKKQGKTDWKQKEKKQTNKNKQTNNKEKTKKHWKTEKTKFKMVAHRPHSDNPNSEKKLSKAV